MIRSYTPLSDQHPTGTSPDVMASSLENKRGEKPRRASVAIVIRVDGGKFIMRNTGADGAWQFFALSGGNPIFGVMVNLGENVEFWAMLSAVDWLSAMPLLCR